MTALDQFANCTGSPEAAAHGNSRWFGAYPAIVTDVKDPDGQGRVKVALPWAIGPSDDRYEAWARLATLMAGDNRGTWFVPDKNDEVLIIFQGGDPSYPFVIGSLWNGKDSPPASMDGAGSNPQKVIKTRGGTTVTFDDSKGQETFSVEVPDGPSLTLRNGPGSVVITDDQGSSIEIKASGIRLTAASKLEINCSAATINASMLTVNCPVTNFSGKVTADQLDANHMVAQSYTNGSGNVW